jgi:hypothetical protein
MKELDFQDCKVRVTNVDSQAAGSDIVIQVIGEISNKSAPHRKFVQTFVLATQTNGYFVLNDIFRYIADEEEPTEQEEPGASLDAHAETSGYQEPIPTVEPSETKALTSSNDSSEQERDAHIVDEELEKVIQDEEPGEKDEKEDEAAPPAQVNGTPVPEGAETAEAEDAPVAAVQAPDTTAATEAAPIAEPSVEPEIEKAKEPTPPAAPVSAPTPPAQAAPPPPKAPAAAAPPKPAAPRTWASLAASANRSAAAPASATSASAPGQQKPAQQSQPATASQTVGPATATGPAREPSPSDGQQGDGWHSVGGDHSRKQSKTQGQTGSETPRFRAYIKNVYPSVDGDALRAQLSKYGELSYFDISRQKVSVTCVFFGVIQEY